MNAKEQVFDSGAIHLKDGKIEWVGELSNLPSVDGARVIDTTDCIVMPGLINGHTHVAMSLLKGIAEDKPLEPWLNEVIFPLERKWGNAEFVELGARLSIAEMLRTGTTTFNDMYYFEHAVAKAADDIGIRAICGQTIVEISNVENSVGKLVEDLSQFVEQITPYKHIRPAIAPHSVYGVTRKVLTQIFEFCDAHSLPIHMHLSETQVEVDQCRAQFGKTPPQYCHELGLFDHHVIAAHGVKLDERDLKIFGKAKAGVVYNPESNSKLGTGICPVHELQVHGAHVCFGTDGSASNNNLDLLQECDFGSKLQNFRLGPGVVTSRKIVQMLTIDAAKVLRWDDEIGSLEVGKAADVIAIDTSQPHAQPLYDPYAHIVYGATGQDVKHTFVAGKHVLDNGQLTTIDVQTLLSDVRQFSDKIRAGR